MFKVALCSVLLGGLWSLFEYNAWFSFGNYSLKAPDPALERAFWELLPSRVLRFWPFFVRDSRNVGGFLEKKLPVAVRTEMRGLGSFSTRIDLLSPWLVAEWRGQLWVVSREGRMWNTADSSMRLSGMEIPERPLWRIPTLPETLSRDVLPLPRGVFPSFLPTGTVEEFLARLGLCSWFRDVQDIELNRRAGSTLFKLGLVRGKQKFTVLIQRNGYGWQELGLALEQIVDRLSTEGGDHLIDATYENKIVVRNLSTGAGEGSSK